MISSTDESDSPELDVLAFYRLIKCISATLIIFAVYALLEFGSRKIILSSIHIHLPLPWTDGYVKGKVDKINIHELEKYIQLISTSLLVICVSFAITIFNYLKYYDFLKKRYEGKFHVFIIILSIISIVMLVKSPSGTFTMAQYLSCADDSIPFANAVYCFRSMSINWTDLLNYDFHDRISIILKLRIFFDAILQISCFVTLGSMIFISILIPKNKSFPGDDYIRSLTISAGVIFSLRVIFQIAFQKWMIMSVMPDKLTDQAKYISGYIYDSMSSYIILDATIDTIIILLTLFFVRYFSSENDELFGDDITSTTGSFVTFVMKDSTVKFASSCSPIIVAFLASPLAGAAS